MKGEVKVTLGPSLAAKQEIIDDLAAKN